jgi:hypothetical protein
MNEFVIFLIVMAVIVFLSFWIVSLIMQGDTNRLNKYHINRLKNDYKELQAKHNSLVEHLKLSQTHYSDLYIYEKKKG